MVMQAFIDESAKGESLVMAGCIATPETWAAFSKDWSELLPRFGRIDSQGRRYFHMTETKDLDIVRLFYRIMERYIPIFISVRIGIDDVRRARNRIYVVDAIVDWTDYANPYFVAYRCLLDKFHSERAIMTDAIPMDEKVDFYFEDNPIFKNAVRNSWNDYIAKRPDEVRHLYGSEPKFESPFEFLPLQAADLWAWWVRRWVDGGSPETIGDPDFGSFKHAEKPRLTIDIAFTEDQLVRDFEKIAKNQVGHRQVIVLPKARDQ